MKLKTLKELQNEFPELAAKLSQIEFHRIGNRDFRYQYKNETYYVKEKIGKYNTIYFTFLGEKFNDWPELEYYLFNYIFKNYERKKRE